MKKTNRWINKNPTKKPTKTKEFKETLWRRRPSRENPPCYYKPPTRKMMGIYSEGMIISAICEYEGEEKLNLIMLDNNIPAGSKLY